MRRLPGLLLMGLLLPLLPVAAEQAPPGPERVSAPLLLDAGGCRGCHRIGGHGGTLGPDLAGVGQRLSRERLRRQLLAPRQLDPTSAMPAYDHLSAAEIELLLDYLARL